LVCRHLHRRSHAPSSTPFPLVIAPLSLHDALPISAFILDGIVLTAFVWVKLMNDWLIVAVSIVFIIVIFIGEYVFLKNRNSDEEDRKSTRLNSSHVSISYAVFCLKKKSYEARTANL